MKGMPLEQFFYHLGQVFVLLGQGLGELSAAFPLWPLVLVWIAWWLGAVNWKKVWPVLAHGGWAPTALLVVIVALAWSRLAPATWDLGPRQVPNFWWQFVAVSLGAATALFCGWLQGVIGTHPLEVNLDPPAAGHGHEHGHHEAH
jgi:hypothetical protein